MDNKLYNRRKELGLSLEQVGDMCGVGKSTVRKWENGMISNMGRDKIVLLAKALQTSPLFILQADSKDEPLSKSEIRILSYYRELNSIGQKEAEKQIKNLTYIPQYKKETFNLETIAAHNDNNDPEQIALMEEDLKDL